MLSGISIDVARTRINRYERGVNECDAGTASRIAKTLGYPLAALYADSEVMAKAIAAFAALPARQQQKVMEDLTAKAASRRKRKGE